MHALNDSGTQLRVVSEWLFGWCKENTVGSVQLNCFGRGHTIQAPLVNLSIGVSDVNGGHHNNSITVMCAIADLRQPIMMLSCRHMLFGKFSNCQIIYFGRVL